MGWKKIGATCLENRKDFNDIIFIAKTWRPCTLFFKLQLSWMCSIFFTPKPYFYFLCVPWLERKFILLFEYRKIRKNSQEVLRVWIAVSLKWNRVFTASFNNFPCFLLILNQSDCWIWVISPEVIESNHWVVYFPAVIDFVLVSLLLSLNFLDFELIVGVSIVDFEQVNASFPFCRFDITFWMGIGAYFSLFITFGTRMQCFFSEI